MTLINKKISFSFWHSSAIYQSLLFTWYKVPQCVLLVASTNTWVLIIISSQTGDCQN